MKSKYILNLNGSIDDCILLWESLFINKLDIKAIYISAGACAMPIAANNIRHILEKYNRSIPVYLGESTLLDGTKVNVHPSAYTLGEYKYNLSSTRSISNSYMEHMSYVLTSNEHVTIISSGFTTNIAKCIQNNPSCAGHIDKILVLGPQLNTREHFVDPPELPTYYSLHDNEAMRILTDSGVKIVILPIDLCYDIYVTPRQRYYLKNLNQTGLMLSEMFDKYNYNENAHFVSPALLTCATRLGSYRSFHAELDTESNRYIESNHSNILVVDKLNVNIPKIKIFKLARKSKTFEEINNE